MSDETVITGRVEWAGSGEVVPGAIVSIYTLVPAGLVGRAEADESGDYWMKTDRHWASAFDIYVVVLSRRGELLQVIADGPRWLSGARSRLDVAVRGRWRRSGPSDAVRAESGPSPPAPPTKCAIPTAFWPSHHAGRAEPPEFLGGGRGVRRLTLR